MANLPLVPQVTLSLSLSPSCKCWRILSLGAAFSYKKLITPFPPLMWEKLYPTKLSIKAAKKKVLLLHKVELSMKAWKQEEESSHPLEAFHREEYH